MDQIGRYKIESELGRGGFGCVYRAIDPTVGRAVAIKVLVSDGDRDLLARFRNEAAATGKLRHKNIVTIYDYGEQDGIPYLVMEYLDGQDLEKVHASGRKLTLFEKVSIMSQVAEGLRHAHMNGIVHRDVKPANIMLLADGSAKIMDFGIARLITSRTTRLTLQGNLIGTLPYMAPEQLQGGEIDQLCDIFAFGTIFYWLITGVQPFTAPDPGSVIYRVTSVDPAPVRTLVPDCPPALEEVISRAMQKPRELRYQSLEDLQFDTAPIRLQLEAELSLSYIADAAKAYETGDLEDANRLIRQASELNPNNPRARELRDRIRHDAQLKMVRERSAAALAAARNQMLAGQFTDAIRLLEGALRVDPENTELSGVLEEVKNAATRARRAATLLDEARRELASHNLTSAYRSAMESLQNAPDNPEATALLTAIRKEIEQRERERRLQEMLTQVQSLADAQSYDEALALLADLEAGYPSSNRVKQLLASVHFAREEQERQRKLARELESAKQVVAESRWQQAVEQLEALRREFPANDEVASLLAYCRDELAAQRKADEIERILRESRTFSQAREFQSALNLIKGGLRAWPDDPALTAMAARVEEARQAHERETAIDEVTRRVREHLGLHRYGEALVEVNAAIRAWDSERLKQLKGQVEREAQEYERERAIEDLAAAARQELDAGRFGDAIHALEAGLARFGRDSRLEEMLARARAGLEEQQRQLAVRRVIRETDAAGGRHDFETALSDVVAALRQYPHEDALLAQLRKLEGQRLEHSRKRAESLGQARRFQEALELVGSLLREYPADNELLSLQRTIGEDWERHRREEAILAALDKAGRLQSAGQLAAAIELLDAELGRFPGEERLAQLRSEIGKLRAAELRAIDIRSIGERAAELLHRYKFDDAIAELSAGLERYPDAESLPPILNRAQEAKAEAQRRAAIQQVIRDASELLAQDEFEQAIDILQRGIAELAHDPELTSLLGQASEAKGAKERQVAVENAVQRGSGLLADSSHDAAIALVQRTLDIYPGEAQLTALLHRALQARADWERKRRVGAALDAAAKLRETGDSAKAMKALEPALREYPEEKPLLEAYAALRKEVERRTALEHLLGSAHVLKRAGEFAAALQALDEAEPSFPGEPQIARLREELEKARTDAEVTAAVNSIETLRSNGAVREAAAELEQALAKYPDRKLLVRLQSPIAADLEALKRREAAALISREAQVLLEKGKLAESIAALEEGLVVYPGEADLVTLLAYAKETAEARRRAEAIADVAKSARALLKNGKPGEAVSMLEAARREYPNEEGIASLLDRARAEHRDAEKTQAIRGAREEAERLRAQGRYAEATRILEQAVERFGPNQEIEKAGQAIRAEAQVRAREERVRGAAESARQRLGSGDPDGAAVIVHAALEQDKDQPQLRALLKETETRARELRVSAALSGAQKEIESGRPGSAAEILRRALAIDPAEKQLTDLLESAEKRAAEQRRAAAIEAAFSSASAAAARHEFDAALRILREAESQAGGDPRLSAAAADVQTKQAAHTRQVAIDGAVREASNLEGGGRYAEAASVLTAALEKYPDAEILTRQKSKIQEAAEQRRAAAVEAALSSANAAAARREFDAALRTLRQAESQAGGDPRLSAAAADVQTKQAAHTRQVAIDGAVREASNLEGGGRYAEAASVLTAALEKYPDAEILTRQKSKIQEAAEQRRAAAIETAFSSASAAAARCEFDAALRILRQAESQAGGDPRLSAAAADVHTKQAAHTRQVAIDGAVREAANLEGARRYAEAASVLTAALGRYPDAEILSRQRSKILDAAEQERQRRRAEGIENALASAQKALAARQFDIALKGLREAAQSFGADPRFPAAISDIETQQAAHVRQSAIESAHQEAGSLMAKGRYGEAASAVTVALGKYPDAGVLQALKERIEKEAEQSRRQNRVEEIDKALASAAAAVAALQFDAAIQTLRNADKAAGGDPRLTAAIGDAEARRTAHARETAIAAAVNQAQGALGKKRREEASSIVAAALAKFPGERALLDLRVRIDAEAEQERQQKQRKADLDSLKQLPEQAKKAKTMDAVDQVVARRTGIAAAHSNDPDFAPGLKKVDVEIEAARKRLAPKQVPVAAGSAAASEPVPVPAAPAKPASAPAPASAPSRFKLYAGVGAAAAALAAAGLYLTVRQPAPAAHLVQVVVSPATATIRVGGQTCSGSPCKLTLSAGKYEMTAQAPGYEAVVKPIAVADRDIGMEVSLRPLPTAIRVSTNLESGSVNLDGRQVGTLQGGELEVPDVPAGTHTLRVSGPEGAEASVSFDASPAELPKPKGRVQSRNLKALVAASLGAQVAVHAEPGERITVNGEELPASRVLEHTGTGPVEIKAGPDGTAYVLGSSHAPALTLFLHANRDTGTLVVETRQDGAAVFVDQRRYSRGTEQGMIRIPLATGSHTIRVEKQGYQTPPQQQVEIAKDGLERLSFDLRPQPGTLVVVAAIPGTRVLLDGSPLGTVQGRSSFPVPAGEHTVELEKDRYVSRKLPVRIAPGAQFEIAQAQTRLTESAPATPPPQLPPPAPKVVETPKPVVQPEPVRAEVRDWDALKDSRDVTALEGYRRKYPNTPMAEQAAQKIERIEGDAALASKDARTLRAFVEKYPSSPLAPQARKQVDQLEWDGLNKKDAGALKAYIAQHPSSPFRSEADAELSRLGNADRSAKDREEIGKVLSRYAQAFEAKDVGAIQSVWPAIPAGTLDTLRKTFKGVRSISVQLRTTSLQIEGDTATATCSRQLRQVTDRPLEVTNTVTVRLRRSDRGWVIENLQ